MPVYFDLAAWYRLPVPKNPYRASSLIHEDHLRASGWRAASSHMTATCVKAFRKSPRDACLAGAGPARLFPARARNPRRGSYQTRMLVSSRLRIKGFRPGGTCADRKRNHCHEAIAFSKETRKTVPLLGPPPRASIILADPKTGPFSGPKN